MDTELFERYSRQILFAEIGEQGQHRLHQSSAVIVGCGALGTGLANLLVRAGIGRLRIVDRDFVEPSNLQRQLVDPAIDPPAMGLEQSRRSYFVWHHPLV